MKHGSRPICRAVLRRKNLSGANAPCRRAGSTPSEITGETWEYGRKGLLLGRRKGGLIGWDDNRHVLTVAGSRAGKGVSLIVPNLILYEGSAFVVDPKGENAAITAGRRGKGTRKSGAGLGQDVYVLDPFDVSGKRRRRKRPVSFNPLAELDIDDEDVVEDASMFAEALITHPEKDRHWTELAQALLRALILVALADPRSKAAQSDYRTAFADADGSPYQGRPVSLRERIQQGDRCATGVDRASPRSEKKAFWLRLHGHRRAVGGHGCARTRFRAVDHENADAVARRSAHEECAVPKRLRHGGF